MFHGLESTRILSLICFLPLAGALAVLLAGGRHPAAAPRRIAAGVALLDLLLALPLWFAFERDGPRFQFRERLPWIPGMGVDYALGLDGLSLLLVLLTTLLGLLASLASWSSVRTRAKEYYALLLLLQTAVLGTFLALDAFLFYTFWQVALVATYLVIALWGGPRRRAAASWFLLPNLAGSALLLLGFLALHLWHGPGLLGRPGLGRGWSFSIERFQEMAGQIPPDLQLWIFAALVLGLAVRVPVFPGHGWLLEAQSEAPAASSALLGGVVLATGIYGFVRLPLPILPAASVRLLPWMAALSLLGLFTGVMVAFRRDARARIAHASVAHLGLAMLGLCSLDAAGLTGGLLQTVSHGLWTGALVLLLGGLAERRGSCRIAELGGLAAEMPRLAGFFLVFTLAAAGVPGLNGFVGGFTLLLGAFDRVWWWAALGALGMVLMAAALLRTYRQAFLGPLDNPENRGLPDLTPRESACLVPLVLLCLWIGLHPQPFLVVLDGPVRHVLAQLAKAGG